MRRWRDEALAAADLVAGRGDLWLPGALAWVLTVGWMPLLVAVARPPTVADLTFLGARVYTAGAWPWNVVAALSGAVLLTVAAFVLVALAEAALAGSWRRGLSAGGVARATAIGFVSAAPTLAAGLAAAIAFVLAATREFTSPAPGDPLVRSLWGIAPFLAAVALAWTIGGLAHAAALREAVLRRAGVGSAIAAVPRRLRAGGSAVVAGCAAALAFRLAYLGVTAALLGVLWHPIGVRVSREGIDAAIVPLLVGFVAIWLCLVLGGGALHAWASMTWTGVLGGDDPGADGAGPRPQGAPYRP